MQKNRCKPSKPRSFARTILVSIFCHLCYAFYEKRHSIFYLGGCRKWQRKNCKNRGGCCCCRPIALSRRRIRRAPYLMKTRLLPWRSALCKTGCCSPSACGGWGCANISLWRASAACVPAGWRGWKRSPRFWRILMIPSRRRWGCWKICSAASWTRLIRRAASKRSSGCGAAPRPRPPAAWG